MLARIMREDNNLASVEHSKSHRGMLNFGDSSIWVLLYKPGRQPPLGHKGKQTVERNEKKIKKIKVKCLVRRTDSEVLRDCRTVLEVHIVQSFEV